MLPVVFPVVLVPGTWGNADTWWQQGSKFHEKLPIMCPRDMYNWSCDLGGVFLPKNDPETQKFAAVMASRKFTPWIAGADALRWYVQAKAAEFSMQYPQPILSHRINVISHSHGGQVVALAMERGLEVDTWISVSMPVRADMQLTYQRVNCRKWIHIYTNEPWWHPMQELGSEFATREAPFPAHNIFEPDNTHSGLLDPTLWDNNNWWDLFK